MSGNSTASRFPTTAPFAISAKTISRRQTTSRPVAWPWKAAGRRMDVRYAQGCDLDGQSTAGIAEAVSIARDCDVAIVFAGNGKATEGEGRDRCCLDLPGVQEQLICAIAATRTPVIVVLIGGGAITMERWIDRVRGLLMAWYPGEEGGTAIADILFGKTVPGGKLPITFPRKTGQLPYSCDSRSSGRKYDYLDLRGRQELFPFGFGLSYVRFSYCRLNVTPRKVSDAATVSVDVGNRGTCAAEEVVQLYLCAGNVLPLQPLRRLIAFRRVRIPAGATKTIKFTLGRRELSTLDTDMQWRMQPGNYQILAGGNSRDCKSARFRIA
ncbi:MAG: hypothetical protein GF398_08740 [Chitinivibrionales bacterium]|nr:hypothetical protein [Chitinivibrionales bacterium]